MIPLRVLIVEDSEKDATLLLRELQKTGYSPFHKRVETSEDMVGVLAEQEWDIVLCDYVMPEFSGLDALKLLHDKGLDLPFVIVSGQIGEDVAVKAMKAGAHDFIMKGSLKRLGAAIQRELIEAENRRQRRKAEEEFKKSESELRNLNNRLIKAQEEERRVVTRELHDQTGQSIIVLGLLLEKMKEHMPESGSLYIKEARQVIREVGSQIRILSQSLHPGMLDSLGLLPILIWYFQEFEKRTGIVIDFRYAGLDRNPPSEVNINVYRIIQEASTNIVRYAGVKDASVIAINSNPVFILQIRDSGRGFDPDKVPSTSSGLRGIRERVYSLGGMVQIQSSPGAGMVIEVELPLEAVALDGSKCVIR